MAKELKRSEYGTGQLAYKIRLFREYLGLTCKTFGEGIGYSGSYISQIEHETRDIPENIVNLICNVNVKQPVSFFRTSAMLLF